MALHPLYTNSHVHSPYSFSSFQSIQEMIDLSVKDEVKVLGINDFYSTKGFSEFSSLSIKNKIFPLLNIEFLAFSSEKCREGVRINDFVNPGRMYFVGKGLDYEKSLSLCESKVFKNSIISQKKRINKIIEKANDYFFDKDTKEVVTYENIKLNNAKDFVGERHVAREIKKVFNLHSLSEEEIRNNILKRGGPAFVEESEDNFLSVNECIKIIRDAGGLPCYPVLLDGKNGEITEYERNFEQLYENLSRIEVRHLDIIPDRNDARVLEKFINFFDKKGFFILFGSEHNTNERKRIRVTHKNGTELDKKLVEISYKGCCSVVSYNNKNKEHQIEIGDEIIKSHI